MCKRVLLIFLISVVSCTSWETKKVSVSELVKEKWEAIDGAQVDTYPIFPACSTLIDNAQLKVCFEDVMYTTFTMSLSKLERSQSAFGTDTTWIYFGISNTGKACLDSIVGAVKKPNLEVLVLEAISKLPIAEGAKKQGVPVNSKFKIPLIIKKE